MARDMTCARKRLIGVYGSKCQYCGYEGSIEVHHIVPVSQGGDNRDSNLVLLCYLCHQKAHGNQVGPQGKSFWEFVRSRDKRSGNYGMD